MFDLCLVIFNDYYNINQNIRLLLAMLFPVMSSYLSKLNLSFFSTEKEYIVKDTAKQREIDNYLIKYLTTYYKKYTQLTIWEKRQYHPQANVYYTILDKGVKFSAIYVKENTSSYYKILYSGDYFRDLLPLFEKGKGKGDNHTKHIKYTTHTNSVIVNWLYTDNHISSVVLDDNVLNNLYKDIDNFYSKKDQYRAKNKRFKRSYLFSGLPGTGKTSLIEEIAIKYKKHILYIKLIGFNLSNLLDKISLNHGYIIVFEDLSQDILLNASKSTTTSNKEETTKGLSTDDILNLFDGMISPFDDNLIFITSNDLSGISKAMLRPGRIDYHIEFTYASKEQVDKIFEMHDIKADDKEKAKYIGKFTTAEILNKIEIKQIQ